MQKKEKLNVTSKLLPEARSNLILLLMHNITSVCSLPWLQLVGNKEDIKETLLLPLNGPPFC